MLRSDSAALYKRHAFVRRDPGDLSVQPTFLLFAFTASFAALAALTVAEAAAAKFDSAQSAACLAALLTVSNAVLEAATALLNIDSAGSEPAGAFLVAKSISSLTLRLPSAI